MSLFPVPSLPHSRYSGDPSSLFWVHKGLLSLRVQDTILPWTFLHPSPVPENSSSLQPSTIPPQHEEESELKLRFLPQLTPKWTSILRALRLLRAQRILGQISPSRGDRHRYPGSSGDFILVSTKQLLPSPRPHKS